MAELGAYYITVMPDMSKFTGAVKRELGDAGASGGKSFASSFSDIVKGSAIGTALGSLATKAGSSIMGGLRQGIGRLDTIQNFPKVMQSLGYSTDEASKSINTIMDHLDGLPTATNEMVELTQSIADSTGDLDLATRAALGFNDMLLATGTSTADAASATAILNRVLGKGSATTAQWQSLQQHIPAQLTAVAKHMLGAEATTEQLHEALENGTVSWNDFLQAIVDLDEKGEGAMDSFYEQARAMTGGIGTALENVQNRIAAGWADIIDAIGREDIAKTIDRMSYGVRDSMKRIGEHIRDLKDKLADTKAFENFNAIVETLGGKFGDLGTAIDQAITGATPIVADFIDKALQWIVDHGEQIGALMDGIGGAFSTVGTAISDAIGTASPVIGDLIEDALQWVLDHGEELSGALQKVADVFDFWADVLSNAFKDAAPVLADCVSDSLQWLLDHGDAVATALSAIATALAAIAAYTTAVTVINGIATALEVISMVSISGGIVAFIGDLGAALLLIGETGGIAAGACTALGTALTFLAANPIVLVIAAIAALVGGLVYFFTQTELGQQLWSDFCTFLSDTWEGFCKLLSDTLADIQSFFEGLPGWWDGVTSYWSNAIDEFCGYMTDGWDKVQSDLEQTWDDLNNTLNDWTADLSSAIDQWCTDSSNAIQDSWDSITSTVSDAAETARSNIEERFNAAKDVAVSVFGDIKQGIEDKLNAAKDFISGIIEDIKNLFNFEWKLPDIKLPHIDWHWEDIGGIVSLPHFDGVSWYAKGGVFDAATLIGVGEAGPEAVLPLNDRTYGEIARGITSNGVGGVNITNCTFNVREDEDIDRIAQALSDMWIRDMEAMAS